MKKILSVILCLCLLFTGVPLAAVTDEVKRCRQRRARKQKRDEQRAQLRPAHAMQQRPSGVKYSDPRCAAAEEGIVRLLYLDPTLFRKGQPPDAALFTSPELKSIYTALLDKALRGEEIKLAALSAALTPQEMSLLTGIIQTPADLSNAPKALADYIDILLLHWPDPKVSLEETFGAMNRLKEQGIIGHIGASNLTKDQMIEAEQYTEIEVYQPHFSMLTQENEETIRWAHEKGIGVMAYGSLGGGLLTGRYRTVETYETMDNRNRFYGRFFQEPFFSRVMLLLEDMQAIADRHKAAVSEVALNWSRQKPYSDTCIVGAQKRSRVESNVKCLDWNLTAEEMDMLDAAIREKLAD